MSATKGKTVVTGPYRATKLWNDAVRSFYNEMPLSRHWRGLKQYDNCYTGSEAIDWLHDYLRSNPNFGQNVSREQATKLLRKFVKCGLIVGARGSQVYAEDFRDNRELYKFGNQSPLKVLRTPGRTPLAPIIVNALSNNGSSPVLKGKLNQEKEEKKFMCNSLNENISNEHTENFVSTKVLLSEEKVNEFWKETFFEKLEMLSEQLMVGGDGSSPLISLSSINATWIRHNMILLKSKSISRAEGLSSSEVLPSWVLSAMNSLVNWPNSSSSICNIPNYPGVEVDIFKVVREFFSEMVVPLIPFELYDPIVRLYIGAEFLDIANRTPSCIANSAKMVNNQLDHSISSITSYDSVEDLILNISSGTNVASPKMETGKNVLSSNSFDFPEGNKQVHKESRTPVINGFSSIPRSLRLNKLNNYTNFKDSYLYTKDEKFSPSVSNKCDSFEENISHNPSRVTLKSLKNRSLFGGKIKEQDYSNSSTSGFKKGLKTEELDNYCLPPNSCFETAFTSDSPRTRVIPQKSIDTIHFRHFSNALRPKSIAVSSLSSQSLVDKVDASRCSSSLSKSTLTDSDSYNCLDRSLSEGNLLKISSQNLNTGEDNSLLKKSSNSRSMLAAKVRDSIKRKRTKDTKHKRNKSCNTDTEYKESVYQDIIVSKNSNCENLKKPESLNFMVSRMRTKSGGYENPALSIRSFSPETTSSTSSFDVNDFRNTSGGYINTFCNSKSSLDQESRHTESKSTQTNNYDYTSASFHCKRIASRRHNDSNDAIHSLIYRSKSATPDGCLSHSLLSARSNSVYLSALSGLDQTSLSYNSFTSKSPENSSNHSISPPHLPKREPKVQMNSSEFGSFRNNFDSENNICEKCGHSPKSLSSSANELSDDWVDRTPFGAAPPFVRGGLWKHYYSSPSKRFIEHQSRLLRKVCGRGSCVPGLLTKVGKEICIEILRLLFLNLESRVRRKLYLLLKMMNKVSNNDKLQIDNLNTNRALMVKTFTRSVFLSNKERDYDEMLATRIVTFMMDNFDALFSPPESLAVLVHRKINENSCGSGDTRFKSLLSLHQPITYCRQVTPEAYEKQKLTGSQHFLEELLDQIVDGKMTEKEKKKKLKEFKLHHPNIYNKKFPSTCDGKENQMIAPAKPRKLKGLKKFASIKAIARHKSFRI